MKKNNFIMLMSMAVAVPLLIGLHLQFKDYYQHSSELATSMDVQAVDAAVGPVDHDATGGQTIDTVNEDGTISKKAMLKMQRKENK